MGRVEFTRKVQPAKVDRLAKSTPAQVRKAAYGLPGDVD